MKNLAVQIESSFPKDTVKLLRLAGRIGDKLGLNIYTVGGVVRDLLLGVQNLDIDLTVEGDGIEYAAHFAGVKGGKLVRHERFGTATVYFKDGAHIDIASSRIERYPHPASLPEVGAGAIRADLSRRDFTINALAVRLNPAQFGELVDLFDGENALRKGVLRVLHELSFEDDPTRIFRAVRFCHRYKFRIEPRTRRLMKRAIDRRICDSLSGRRIRNEISLLLNEEDPPGVIKRMAHLDVLKCINKKIEFNTEKNMLLRRIKKTLPLPAKTTDWLVYFMGIVYGLRRRELKEISERLMLGRKEKEKILSIGDLQNICMELAGDNTPAHVYCTLKRVPDELLVMVIAVSNTRQMKRLILKYFELRKTKINLNGNDLLNLGFKPGPDFNKILEEILYAKLNGLLKTKQDEMTYLADNFAGEKSKEG